jgi:Lantibiotic biosynthesis dehydratase C-term
LTPDWSRWRSCHLYYHGDGNLLLTHLVGPLAGSLLRADAVEHFFFIRYELGGPHVRLRLRVAPGAEEAAEEAVKRAAADFFARWPSVQPRPAELVRRRTREIMAADPSEADATLYPDNSLRIAPFVPEVNRYGGPDLISASLGFFALSSVRALDFARTFGGEPRSRQLLWMLRALAAQALGFARDEPELLKLLGYAAVKPSHPLAPFADRGDHAFARQPEALRNLLLDVLATGTEAGILDEARRLAADIRSAASAVREDILKSHMHMTANRLGLRNPEEAYLGRMLWRAAQEDGGLAPALRDAWRGAPGSPLDAGRGLEDLLPTAFAAVMKMAAPAAAEAGAFS